MDQTKTNPEEKNVSCSNMCRYKHTTNPSVIPPYQNEDWENHDLKEFSTRCRYRINQPNKSTLNSTPCQTQPISVKLVFKPLVETFDSTLVLQASLFLLLYKTRENTGGKMIMPSSKCQLPLPLSLPITYWSTYLPIAPPVYTYKYVRNPYMSGIEICQRKGTWIPIISGHKYLIMKLPTASDSYPEILIIINAKC